LYHARILAVPEDEGECFQELVEAYAAGKYLDDKKFCNAILHAMVEVIEEDDECPRASVVARAYELTTDSCRLRQFLLDMYLKLGALHEEDLDTLWNELPGPLVKDLFSAFMKKKAGKEREDRFQALRDCLPAHDLTDESDTDF
jgi:hypothetical protein